MNFFDMFLMSGWILFWIPFAPTRLFLLNQYSTIVTMHRPILQIFVTLLILIHLSVGSAVPLSFSQFHKHTEITHKGTWILINGNKPPLLDRFI